MTVDGRVVQVAMPVQSPVDPALHTQLVDRLARLRPSLLQLAADPVDGAVKLAANPLAGTDEAVNPFFSTDCLPLRVAT